MSVIYSVLVIDHYLYILSEILNFHRRSLSLIYTHITITINV